LKIHNLFAIWSSGEKKYDKDLPILGTLRAAIAGSDAYEDVLKKQSEAFCYRLSRKGHLAK